MDVFGTAELEKRMLDWVCAHGEKLGEPLALLGSETELISERVLDSIAFTELIVFVESLTGLSIDMGDIDHDDLQSIGGLCRHVRKLMTPSP
jgi:acyl carrier protein